jgi:hypothetical protein
MAQFQNLPGGAPKPQLRDAIDRLAEEAREQDRLAAEETRKLFSGPPISRFIRVGIALIVVELAMFGILYGRRQQKLSATTVRPNLPELTDKCAALAHETYWKIAAYIRDQGHPPAALSDLVGKYVEKLPTDPVTRKPLGYSTDGTGFDLHCPRVASAR